MKYETSRSLQQDLTFSTLSSKIKERDMELTEVHMRNLHLIGEDGLYTNLAHLLSDQCEHTIKVAYFQGNNKLILNNRKEYSGSILKQLDDALEYISMHNMLKAEFEGLYRIDKYSYPIEAIREALLNCIVHRDYNFSASTIINIFENRIEFMSLGGLINGLSIDAVMSGASQSRNIYLAELFYRMKLIESFGTGIGKIMNLYVGECRQPEFNSFEGAFQVVLPNRNEKVHDIHYVNENYVEYCSQKVVRDIQKEIVEFVKEKGQVQRKEIQELLDLKQTRTYEYLKDLCDKGILKSSSKGKNTYYEMNQSNS